MYVRNDSAIYASTYVCKKETVELYVHLYMYVRNIRAICMYVRNGRAIYASTYVRKKETVELYSLAYIAPGEHNFCYQGHCGPHAMHPWTVRTYVKSSMARRLPVENTERGVNYQLLAVITEVAQWGTPSCSRPQPATDNGVRDGRSSSLVAPPSLMDSTPWAPRIARCWRGLQIARLVAQPGLERASTSMSDQRTTCAATQGVCHSGCVLSKTKMKSNLLNFTWNSINIKKLCRKLSNKSAITQLFAVHNIFNFKLM